MSINQKRLDLRIDIFEKTGQRALALPTLTPPELVEAILQEFQELEYLSDSPADYRLLRAGDLIPLDNESPLGQQDLNREKLVLVENETPPPPGTRRAANHIYLREQVTGKVHKLHWSPAIIGRSDRSQPHNDWLAVNLAAHKAGLRVSRRHAQITEENGQYFIEGLSRNPTFIKDKAGKIRPVTEEKQPLSSGETILLERSSIELKLIIRPTESTTQAGSE